MIEYNDFYKLTTDNYYNSGYIKKQIIIGNTYSNDLSYIERWLTRNNGKYKATAPYSILKDGTILKHYEPEHHSDFVGISEIDRYAIPITLQNTGWVIKDSENDCYIDWLGDIYKEDINIKNIRWRNHAYWEEYTDEQIESLVKLCKFLCLRFDIPLKAMEHNTKTDVDFFEGITYKSNFSKYFCDVNPTFDFLKFRNNIELNK